MVRCPAFVTRSAEHAERLEALVLGSRSQLAAAAAVVSHHARLVDIQTYRLGETLHVRFCYETGDAAGQNMTTVATQHACLWLLARVRGPAADRAMLMRQPVSDSAVAASDPAATSAATSTTAVSADHAAVPAGADTLDDIIVDHFWIESLMSGDKRASSMNFLVNSRGISVQADCRLPDPVLGAVLKVSAGAYW